MGVQEEEEDLVEDKEVDLVEEDLVVPQDHACLRLHLDQLEVDKLDRLWDLDLVRVKNDEEEAQGTERPSSINTWIQV